MTFENNLSLMVVFGDEMKTLRIGSAKTYKRLLAAAVDVFAEKGYRDATIAEICKRANANIAAVNYHFGDKETLYKESWRYSFSEAIKTHPPDGGVSIDALPEERLRGQITALLHRVADKDNKEFLILQKEFANPTGLLNEIMEEVIRPLREKTQASIRELIGSQVSDAEVQFCEISIISQCINPVIVRRNREEMPGPPGIEDIEAYSNHVMKFSLAGLRAIRKESEKKV
jgi:AcrR family transcriptional regulator